MSECGESYGEGDVETRYDRETIELLHKEASALRTTLAKRDAELELLKANARQHEECIGELEYAAENARLREVLKKAYDHKALRSEMAAALVSL